MPEPSAADGNISVARTRAEIQAVAAESSGQVQVEVPLRDLTTFRIGGPALGICRLQTLDDARRFQAAARERGLPVSCLGGGSNVLADDRGFCGLVLKMEIATFTVRGDSVTVGAGLGFDDLIVRSLQTGLVGLEFASGIPGTVGGAIVGNAGCYGHEIGEFLVEATLLSPDGDLVTVGPEELSFGYRHSALKGGDSLLLQAVLHLQRGDPATAGATRQAHLQSRRHKHPVNEPCAGSYFRNLPGVAPNRRRRAAGELLELAGAKALCVGGAAVYARHANIIINTGSATCADVLALAKLMKAAVRKKFGIELQEEVRYLRWRDH